MTVIINDFEVVAEPPPPPQTGPATQVEPPPEAPTPLDLERIAEQQAARLARVRAH